MPDGKVVYRISGDNSQFQEDIKSTEKIADDGFSKIKSFGTSAFKAIGAISVASVGAAFGAISGAVKGTTELAEYGDNIDKMSQKLGMSAEAYQEWDAILQHSGTNIESMQSSMKTLATAAETDSKAFEQLGLSQEAIANMSQEELFGATISALQEMDDETERTYLAGQLLGRGATELGALLNTSAEDTEAMRQAVHDLGGVMSDDAVKASAEFQDNLQDMQTAIGGVKRSVAAQFMPALNDMMQGFTALITGKEGAEEELIAGIEAFLGSFTSAAGGIAEVAETILPSIVAVLISELPSLVDMGFSMIQTLVESLIENLPMIISTALEIILSLANGIAQSLPELIPTIVDVIITIVETLIDNVDKLVDASLKIIVALAVGLIQALPELIKKAPEIIISLVNALIENVPKVVQAGKDILKSLLDAIEGMIKDFFDIGSRILDGLKDGIISKATALKDSVVDAVSGAWGAAKRFLGISSPSKLFMEMGGYIDEGLAEGIEGKDDLPASALSNMVSNLVPMFDTAFAAPSVTNQTIINNTPQSVASGSNSAVMTLNGRVFGELVYDFNGGEDSRIGVVYGS